MDTNSTDYQTNERCNASNELSEEEEIERDLRLYKFLMEIVFVLVVNVAGYTGNVLTFLVLLRDRAASRSTKSTNFILRALSLSDICFLVCSLLFLVNNLETDVGAEIAVLHKLLPYAMPCVFYAGHSARMLRNWTVVLVSVERWVAIFWPLRAQLVCTVKNARMAVVTLVGIALFYNVPRFFEGLPAYNNICVNGKVIQSHEIGEGKPELLKSNWYNYSYRTIFYILFVIGGPIAILIVLNALLVRGISKATRMQASLISASHAKPKPKPQISTIECEGGVKGKKAQESGPTIISDRQSTTQSSPRFKEIFSFRGLARSSQGDALACGEIAAEDRPMELTPSNPNESLLSSRASLNSKQIRPQVVMNTSLSVSTAPVSPISELRTPPAVWNNKIQLRNNKRCTIQEPVYSYNQSGAQEKLGNKRLSFAWAEEEQSMESDDQVAQARRSTFNQFLHPSRDFHESDEKDPTGTAEPTIELRNIELRQRHCSQSSGGPDCSRWPGGGHRPASAAPNNSSLLTGASVNERCSARSSWTNSLHVGDGGGGGVGGGRGGQPGQAPPPQARKSSAQKRSRSMSKTRNEVTRLCIAVIGVYIFCELPALVYQLLFNLKVHYRVQAIVLPFSNLTVTMNSAINFYIYVFLGKRFRRILLQLLRRILCHRERARTHLEFELPTAH